MSGQRAWTMPQSLAAILDERMQAYPAEHRGVRMRSQLEASFARHLDSLGAVWDYEPRRYFSADGDYLPDFVVGLRFFEVKPTLEEVPGAMDRMQAVLRDEPEALLVVACAEGCEFFVRDPSDGAWSSFVERWAH